MSRLGRRIQFDEKSRNYPVKAIIRQLEPVSQMWDYNKDPLDQGAEGSCVGHGIAHELIANPVPCLQVDHDYARYIYLEAQKVDEWPGENYEGTSVLAGLKIIKSLGWCDEYRWSFEHLDTQLGISYEGPGISGLNWYTGMLDVDSQGFIKPTGYIEGGHCICFLGVNIEQEYFTLLNSWGAWGIDGTGRCKLSFSDYEKLRVEQGEMAFLIGRHDIGEEPVPPEPPPPEPSPCQVSNGIAKSLNAVWALMGRRTRFYTKGGESK